MNNSSLDNTTIMTTCNSCSNNIRNSGAYDSARCIIRTQFDNVWLIENTKRLTTGDNSNVKLALPYTLYNRLAKDHIDSYSTKETRMAGLFIEDRNIELINGAVNDPIIRGDLIDAHHKLKETSQNAN